MYKKIITGSRQIFGNEDGDLDYIIIQDQEVPFEHVRDEQNKICEFKYKPMTKEEYFDWLSTTNKWSLNITALLCKEFTDYMDINIFDDDKVVVLEQMTSFFKRQYLLPFGEHFNKYFYKTYLYYLYMTNKSYELSKEELQTLKDIKNNKYRQSELTKLYEFFGCESYLPQILEIYKIPTELEEIQEWLETHDWIGNKIIFDEWTKDDPRYIAYKKERETKRKRQDELLNKS